MTNQRTAQLAAVLWTVKKRFKNQIGLLLNHLNRLISEILFTIRACMWEIGVNMQDEQRITYIKLLFIVIAIFCLVSHTYKTQRYINVAAGYMSKWCVRIWGASSRFVIVSDEMPLGKYKLHSQNTTWHEQETSVLMISKTQNLFWIIPHKWVAS